MKNQVFILLIGLFSHFSQAFAQEETDTSSLPEMSIERSFMERHIRFLSSDALMGRMTGEPGNHVAARYIAEEFRAYGLKPVPGAENDYFQPVPLMRVGAMGNGSLSWKGGSYSMEKDLIMASPVAGDLNAETVYASYGWVDEKEGYNDYEGLDVKGKIVVVNVGQPYSQNINSLWTNRSKKAEWASERGAVALLELYKMPLPWNRIYGFASRKRVETGSGEANSPSIPHLWVNDAENILAPLVSGDKGINIVITNEAQEIDPIDTYNVIGMIPGTDPELKKEYLLLTAHYDHVGTGRASADQPNDTIYNGARDNAFGVAAIMTAAKALAQKAPARSILVMAYTGEEMGLLGSRYYAESPLIPLEQTIFNLNSDGAGYADTSLVVVMGPDRVGAGDEFRKASKYFNLELISNPAPEQNLFDRSDNVSLAAKGVPAPTFSGGFKAFDQSILRHYHQPSDEAESLNFNYVKTFCQAFTYAARLIADKDERPFWVEGDKYEEVGKSLYGFD